MRVTALVSRRLSSQSRGWCVLIVLHPETQPFQVVDQTRIVLMPDDMDITATPASIRREG